MLVHYPKLRGHSKAVDHLDDPHDHKCSQLSSLDVVPFLEEVFQLAYNGRGCSTSKECIWDHMSQATSCFPSLRIALWSLLFFPSVIMLPHSLFLQASQDPSMLHHTRARSCFLKACSTCLDVDPSMLYHTRARSVMLPCITIKH